LTPDQYSDAIVQAFDTWTGVDCGGGNPPSIDLLQLRDVSCAASQYNPSGPNVNVVYFDDNGWAASQDNIDSTLALTTVSFDSAGDILDADMAINSARHDFTVGDESIQEDLVSIVTHEVGHFLGLAHSPRPDAVMYYSYAQGTNKRALTDDDIEAICAVYPPQRKATCNPTPVGGLGDTCSGTSTREAGCSLGAAQVVGDQGAGLPLVFAVVGLIGARGCARQRKE